VSKQSNKAVTPAEGTSDGLAETKKILSTIGFQNTYISVPESVGEMEIKIVRTGDLNAEVTVFYKTVGGSADAGADFEHVEGDIVFEAGATEKIVKVKVVDDNGFEMDEEFFVELSNLRCASTEPVKPSDGEHVIGDPKCTIRIIDDDDPGMLSFECGDEVELCEGAEETKHQIVVRRTCGVRGEVSVTYFTENASAVAGKDYIGIEETTLTFEDCCATKNIELTVCAKGRYENTETFRLILKEPVTAEVTGDAKCRLNDKADGGPETNILTITVKPEPGQAQKTDNIIKSLGVNWDKAAVGNANYADQFKNAIYVNGGDEDADPPGAMDYAMHIISLPWKLLFALIPPTDYCNGWLCFYIALAFIGIVTMLIGDLAGLLGCSMGVPDPITAITFVALGTSLPDTFASKAAAEMDPYADASIGNVTGSNSVNVFLGLGLPWTIGALYWVIQGQTPEWTEKYPEIAAKGDFGFVVKRGALGFSVGVFTGCALVCVGILMARRVLFGGELGGPTGPKIGSAIAMVCLWFVYIALSSMKALDSKGPCD
jgi:solute carrier family 8 (sodium/calcium exchanger)